MSNTLPDLPYAYDALEPYISKQIMTLHHTKHHQTYVNALNAAEQSYAKAATPKERIALQAALKFNGGGHIKPLALLEEPRARAIDRDFGSLDALKKEFNAATLGIQGSGWGWLGLNLATKRLEVSTTPNQDPLLNLVPLIGVDIWEQRLLPPYLNAIWNVINFEEAEKRLLEHK
ncbi:manganese superoxide dismutase [Mycena olivaceomarginata]|nr:manganese superoxide dismutase [Mycena olivaceomarginata]